MLFPPPSRTPSYTYTYIYIPTDKEVEELVERKDGVGNDKRDEEEEADSKEASSITRQKRPEAKKKQRTPRSRC